VVQIHRDSLGRPYQIDDPDLGISRFDFDFTGNLVRSANEKGAVVEYGYDALDRLVMRDTQPSGQVVNAVYDDPAVPFSRGQLTAISELGSECAAVQAYQYDLMGRMVRETTCVGGVSQGMAFGYDPLGRVATVTYPDGEIVDNAYDLAGRLTRVGNIVRGISYDPQDQLRELRFGNGVAEQRSYHAQRGWLTGHSVRSSVNTLFSGSYGYQPDGVLSATSESLGVGDKKILLLTVNRRVTHDSLHRLIGVTANADVTWRPGVAPAGPYATPDALTETIEYDAIGNITFKSGVGAYIYGRGGAGPHAVTTAGATSFAYDAVGNAQSSRSGQNQALWTYDDLGRLITQRSSAPSGGVDVQLGYDPAGQRLSKTVSTPGAASQRSATHYFGKYLERGPDGQLAKLYFAGDRMIALQDPGGRKYYHADRLGSTRVITNPAGVGQAAYDYLSSGQPLMGSPANARDVLFTGHRHDTVLPGATGGSLIYMGARYYDPQIGRFMSADTVVPGLADPQAWNRYAYVLNSPFTFTDPTGHQPWRPGSAPTEVTPTEPVLAQAPPPAPLPQNIDLWGVSWLGSVAPSCFGMPCNQVHTRSTRHIESGWGTRVDLQFTFSKIQIAGSAHGFGASWRSRATPATTVTPTPATPPVRSIAPRSSVGLGGGGSGPTFFNARRTDDHHGFMQKHREKFWRAGFEPNPYCRRMPTEKHRELHADGFGGHWDQFHADYPDADALDLRDFHDFLEEMFGTDQYPMVPYRSKK
jgi:RHS repeat-associated protein